MRHFRILGLITLLLSTWCGAAAHAELGGGVLRIEWEVKNRFRLFRNEADFQRHVAAAQGDGVLAAERRLARESDGRGWARDTVERLCVDRAGKLLEFCERDGEREAYLSPRDHRIGVALPAPCRPMRAASGPSMTAMVPRGSVNGACNQEVKVRLRHGRPTVASVDIVLPDGTAQRLVSEIQVRDVLIAGMGDFDRRRRRQSGPRGAAVRRGLLLQALRRHRILSARTRRLQRQQVLQHGAGTMPASATGRGKARAG